MVDFAGFEMPIQYSSIIAEHKAVRNNVGVFDVSHMGEFFVSGEKALEFVQSITTNDASRLYPGRVQYSAMCYEDGGIVDDLLVYQLEENKYMLVVNASNIEKDFDWAEFHLIDGVTLENHSDDYSLLAIQGPDSQKVMEKLFGKTFSMDYYHFETEKYNDQEIIVSRTGYTGELGYEVYMKVDTATAEKFWDELFEAGKEFNIVPVGLAARDTLRLEMGFCLYGNDIDNSTNPFEAGLGWITKMKKGNFIGKDALVAVKEKGLSRKLIPLVCQAKAIPRKGYPIQINGEEIGSVTSGAMSPILERGIALAYLDKRYTEEETSVNIMIRGKEIPATVTKLPFVKR